MSNRLTPYLDPIMNPGGVQFPVKRGTWDFIENAWMEGDSVIIQSIIGDSYDPHSVYILTGCIRVDSGGTTTISAGTIFYNGEYYKVTGGYSNPTPANIVANLIETSWQPTDGAGNLYADPVGFIGSSTANIHIYRTAQFASGASGSGTISNNIHSDWGNIISVFNPYTSTGITLQSGWSNVGSRFPATYKIINKNTCLLSGTIEFSTTISGSRNVLQLPFTIAQTVGNRPIFVDNGAGFDAFYLNINTSGMVNINGTTASSSPIIDLDGIIFRIL